MKQREKCLGREFDSPHLHRRSFTKVFCVGDDWFRQGKE